MQLSQLFFSITVPLAILYLEDNLRTAFAKAHFKDFGCISSNNVVAPGV